MAKPSRLTGLDVARFIALFGMLAVNFAIVMGADEKTGALGLLTEGLHGRAAASFVVLAGLGMGLSGRNKRWLALVPVTLKRAGFLMVVGLANALIFEADILHFYAVYFLVGLIFLRASMPALIAGIIGVNLIFLGLFARVSYMTSWDFENFAYLDLWTFKGALRHLFYNGWHPVFPWAGFLLFGLLLARLDLSSTRLQHLMIYAGAAMIAVAEIGARLADLAWTGADPLTAALFSTQPMPPSPFYMLGGMGGATLLIGLCLTLERFIGDGAPFRALAATGRITLTLYIAHIYVGMSIIEAMGMLGGQTLSASWTAALAFTLGAIAFALLWARRFKRGPLEIVMRRLCG